VRKTDEKEANIENMVSMAIDRFSSSCFWNVKIPTSIEASLPLVVGRLRKYGGMEGWRLAASITEAAGKERTSWH